mgnify:FL=1
MRGNFSCHQIHNPLALKFRLRQKGRILQPKRRPFGFGKMAQVAHGWFRWKNTEKCEDL